MWLRDWLGQDLAKDGCHARIFTYGYPSKVANSSSDATLSDYAKQFLLSLAAARKAELTVFGTRFYTLQDHATDNLLGIGWQDKTPNIYRSQSRGAGHQASKHIAPW